MEIITKISELKKIIKKIKLKNKTIGFVPTMGALHEGHISLIKKSVKECDYTFVSIFVNPLQFGKNEDFGKYPRPIEKDTDMCKNAEADYVFNPDVKELIGENPLTYVDINELSDNLCGLSRPGHFRGVCTIVSKFFNLILPDKAYFGKKDIQQLIIIKKMTKDLNFDIDIVPCPIMRESDGLAMSSRNAYLSQEERTNAVILNKAIKSAIGMINTGEYQSGKIIDHVKNMINSVKIAKIDYIKIVNQDMKDVVKAGKNDILALAVFFGKTRLIDNHIIGEDICF